MDSLPLHLLLGWQGTPGETRQGGGTHLLLSLGEHGSPWSLSSAGQGQLWSTAPPNPRSAGTVAVAVAGRKEGNGRRLDMPWREKGKGFLLPSGT